MSKAKHPHNAPVAFSLLAITLIFVGWIFIKYPELPNMYTDTARNILKFIGFNRSEKQVESLYTTPSPASTIITEFGSTSEITILEPGTSTSTELQYPTDTPTSTVGTDNELKADEVVYKPSPESVWASAYLTRLERTQASLKLDIGYVREWQQTGGLVRDLKQGSKGTDVKLMQYLLAAFEPSFKSSSVSGTFGPQTKAALMALQKKLDLKQTGVFSDEIRFFFDSIYFKELCPDANPAQDKSFENVSRRMSVPYDYIPSDLIRIPKSIRTAGTMCLSREAAVRLQQMFTKAQQDGYSLAVISAYRSANTQKLLTAYYLRTMGKAGLAGVAEAGHSEHQLGTTVDVSGRSISYAGPSNLFGTSPEGRWLADNSYRFGFILSYPAGKQDQTGYIYEPWHFRYVGVDTAKDIFEEKMTIQEYFNLVTGNTIDQSVQPEPVDSTL